MNRDLMLQKLNKTPNPDVLIIGAGINGAGVFRDLALNGINALLIDRGDFCSGTSATSSHMAHGGIRYLENGEFRLVREAVAERNRMIENAPHLVKPLPTVIPMFKIFSGLLNAPLKFVNLLDRPSERGAMVIKLGLMFYDSFTRKQKTVPKHKFFSREETLRRYPSLNTDIKYSALYYDGQLLSPERLTVEIILDGMDEGDHAIAINYLSLFDVENETIKLQNHINNELITIKPKMIINAAGPWIDVVNLKLGLTTKYIGGTKGSHLVINNPELRKAIGENEFFFENKDGRIVLLLPFHDKVIIGTSDLPIQDPDTARCTPEEEDYFFHLVDKVFPTIKVTKDQVVFRFSGVRPLEFMNAKTTGQITRDHSIKFDTVGSTQVLSLVGGKWTSYRAFSEQVVDWILKESSLSRKSTTENLPVRGGGNLPQTQNAIQEIVQETAKLYSLDSAYVEKLFQRYGSMAKVIAKFIQDNNGTSLTYLNNWNSSEIEFILENEFVEHLDDLVVRRSSIAWEGLLNKESLDEIASIAKKYFKWNESTIKQEVLRTKDILLNYHGVLI
jgi:glycerol-3-phosphate dehydrogenase